MLDLLLDNVRHCAVHTPCQILVVIGLATFFRLHEFEQIVRVCQASTVGSQNPFGTVLHGCPLGLDNRVAYRQQYSPGAANCLGCMPCGGGSDT
jgi:hypothetical protein